MVWGWKKFKLEILLIDFYDVIITKFLFLLIYGFCIFTIVHPLHLSIHKDTTRTFPQNKDFKNTSFALILTYFPISIYGPKYIVSLASNVIFLEYN